MTRPGGRIVMGNWIPNDPTLVAQVLKISSAYSPPPPRLCQPDDLGSKEEHVIERFVGAGVAEDRISSPSRGTRTRSASQVLPRISSASFRITMGPP